MVERGMDHRVRLGGPAAQALRVLERAMKRFRASGDQGLSARVRAGQSEHLVPGADEFGHEVRADEAGRAGEEDTHGGTPLFVRLLYPAQRSCYSSDPIQV